MFKNLSSDVVEDLLFFIYTGNTPNLAKVETRGVKFLSENQTFHSKNGGSH